MNWIEQFAPGSDFGRLALQVIAQVTGVILVAAVLSATLLKRRAAVRHRLWLCCLACILLSPMVAIVLDRFGIALEMVPWTQSPAPATENNVATVGDLQPDAAASPAWEVAAYGLEAREAGGTEAAVEPIAVSSPIPASSPAIEDVAMERLPAFPIVPATATQRGVATNMRQVALGGLVLLWALGVAIGSMRLLLAWRRLSRLRRSLETLDAHDHETVFNEVRHALGLLRLPNIYTSGEVSGPVAIGIFRGGIVLPRMLATSLAPNQLRDVLIHEIAHVLRWDPLVALLQQIASVVYWPHPLVHWVNVRLARSREEVCDNFVLRVGDPCDYARTLLQLSEGLFAAKAQRVGLALAEGRWTLSDRISGILDPRRNAVTAVRLWPGALLALGLAAICIVIGAARPISAKPQAREISDKAVPAKPPERAVRGIVVDEKGQPVANAKVIPVRWEKMIEPATTSPHGSFRLALGGMMFLEEDIAASADDGRLMGLGKHVEPKSSSELAQPVRIVLKQSRVTRVRVRDAKAQPVIGAKVAAVGLDYDGETTTDQAGDALLRVPADARVRWLVARKAGAGFDYFENDRSKDAGRIGPLPPDVTLTLDGARSVRIKAVDSAGRPVPGVDFAPWTIATPTKLAQANIGGAPGMCARTDHSGEATFDWLPPVLEEDVPFLIFPQEYSCPESPVYRSHDDRKVLETRVLRSTRIAGIVRHADGRPAAGILIRAEGHAATNHYCRMHTRTADDGSYAVDVYPEQSFMIAVLDERWAARTLSGVIVREGKPQTGLDLTLVAGTLIHGVVTKGAGGPPVQGATITLSEQGPDLPPAFKAPLTGQSDCSLPQWTTTDDLGRYRFRVGPGRYRIISGDGADEQIVETQAEIVRDLRIRESVERESITGTALENTPTGERPIPGALIEVAPIGSNGFDGRAIANAQGQFELTLARGGSRTILVRDPDRAVAGFTRIGPDTKQVKAYAAPASRISGRVLDSNGRGVLGRRIQLLVDSGPEFQTASRFHLHVTTDANGRYDFRGVAVGSSVDVLVPIDEDLVDRSGLLSVQHVVVRGPDPIEMDDVVLRMKKANAAERARMTPLPGAAAYQPVAPTRAVCEAVLREIGRDPVTPEMVDQAWLLTRPQFNWHANIKEIREALGEQEMIGSIDEIARRLTGRPADTLNVFKGTLEFGSGWDDEAVRQKITEWRAESERAAITVRGTVVEEETGKPVAGATVYASDGLARTDAAGKFELRTRAPQAKGMIWVEAEGFALCEYPALVGTPKQAEVRISLGKEDLIGGLVVGPDGRPVAGTTIMANIKHFEFRAPTAGATAGGSSFGFPIEVHTGADGRFVMRGMPRGLRIGWWEVRHPEFQTLSSSGEILSAAESTTLKLSPGCSVSGVVVDESGRSISGADVQIRSPSSAGYQNWRRTNRDGRFRFGNVSPGRWTVFVQPLRHAPVHGTIVASANRPAESQFVVGPSSYISGRVIGPDGSPIEGATVGWAKPVNERGQKIEALELTRITTTAKDGTFRFGPISQGNYALTGLAEHPRRIGHVIANANSVDIVIRLELEQRK